MDPGRLLPAERPVDHGMQREGRQPFRAADDMRDLHQVIVDRGCQVVEGKAIGFQQDVIIQVLVFNGDIPAQHIIDRGGAFAGHLEADDILLAGCDTPGSFHRVELAAGAVVMRDLLAALLLLAHLCQAVGRAKAVVGGALLDQLAAIVGIDLLALALAVGSIRTPDIGTFVPVQPQPVQTVVNLLFRTFHQAFAVGILNTQDELATGLAGKQVIIQGGAGAAQMKRTGRRGGEANTGGG